MKVLKLSITSIILVSYFIISGCCNSSYYGNYSNASKRTISDIADKITLYLVNEYPPSYSRLNIRYLGRNLFENELLKYLRIRGYYIPSPFSISVSYGYGTYYGFKNNCRHNCPNLWLHKSLEFDVPAHVTTSRIRESLRETGTDFKYVINTISPKLYQVTIYLGSRSHNRAFKEMYNGKVYPLGPWTKECHK